jgi:glycosyltransferase involved in cell wall biosynthesis
VEVFSTCAVHLGNWSNVTPAGDSVEHGVVVHRHPIIWQDERRHTLLFQRLIGGEPLPPDTQFEWLQTGAHSPALYCDIAKRLDEFDLFFGAPYPFPVVHYAMATVLPRAVIWPCLHDEPYAYLAPTRLLLRDAKAIVFNTEPERMLAAEKLSINHPRSHVIGAGVDGRTGNADRFRARFGISEPFILYAGRIEDGKNVPLLIDLFEHYKAAKPGDLKLVLMGDGPAFRDAKDVVHIGFQDEQAKYDAMSAALVLCQPSVNESLSFVLLESWLTGTPVLVHASCAVTRHHVVSSGGGLYFNGLEMFAATLDLLRARPGLAKQMGQAGRAYTKNRYSWNSVLNRLESAIEEWVQ